MKDSFFHKHWKLCFIYIQLLPGLKQGFMSESIQLLEKLRNIPDIKSNINGHKTYNKYNVYVIVILKKIWSNVVTKT